MVGTRTHKKNKVNLEDYDYRGDIQNRLLLSHFTSSDLEILEEIIYSPPQFSVSSLAEKVAKTDEQVFETLTKLSDSKLFKVKGKAVVIDKEMRKYFEVQMNKFEENFSPGMEFLQSLLKKVPIHILPDWYPIPRTSNNIFTALIEKYLETPQKFQRYLAELSFGDKTLDGIVKDLFNSPNQRIYSKEVCKRYNLTEEEFERCMLHLEFNFVGFLIFEKKEGGWSGVITPFQEWKDYLQFLRRSEPPKVKATHEIKMTRPSDFSFVEDMSTFLTLASNIDFFVKIDNKENWVPEKSIIPLLLEKCGWGFLETEESKESFKLYVNRVIQKLLLLKLVRIEKSQIFPCQEAKEWLKTSVEKRALNTYKMTINRYSFSEFPQEICTERNIHEIEKSVVRIAHSDWVLWDDFLKSLTVPISESSKMTLTKTGRCWKYTHPEYSEAEILLIQKITFEWLFEGGVVSTGRYRGHPCLRITPFGRSMFG